jgi:hypothetical protein
LPPLVAPFASTPVQPLKPRRREGTPTRYGQPRVGFGAKVVNPPVQLPPKTSLAARRAYVHRELTNPKPNPRRDLRVLGFAGASELAAARAQLLATTKPKPRRTADTPVTSPNPQQDLQPGTRGLRGHTGFPKDALKVAEATVWEPAKAVALDIADLYGKRIPAAVMHPGRRKQPTEDRVLKMGKEWFADPANIRRRSQRPRHRRPGANHAQARSDDPVVIWRIERLVA